MPGQPDPGFIKLPPGGGGDRGDRGAGRPFPPPPPFPSLPQFRGNPDQHHPGGGGGHLPRQPGPGPGPGPGQGQGHGQQNFPAQNPMNKQKKPERKPTGILDLKQMRLKEFKDPEICYEELSTYQILTLRKADPISNEHSPSWGRTAYVNESLPQKEIIKQIKHLHRKDRENKRSVAYKMSKLYPHQAEMVANLLQTQKSQETDDQFEWAVCQIDKELRPAKVGWGYGSKKETKTITLFLQRSPRKDLEPVIVYQNVEAAKKEAEAAKKEAERERKEAEKERKEAEKERKEAEKERKERMLPENQRPEMQQRPDFPPMGNQMHPPPRPEMLPMGKPESGGQKKEKGGGRRKSPKREKKNPDSDSGSGYSDSGSESDFSWSTGTGSSSDSRYCREPGRNGHRSHHRYGQRHFSDDSPQMLYAQPYRGEAQRALPYHALAENYVPIVPTPMAPRVMVHQRPMENTYLAELRRADEYRRDAEEYVRARHRAIEEAKYRDRRRFDGYF